MDNIWWHKSVAKAKQTADETLRQYGEYSTQCLKALRRKHSDNIAAYSITNNTLVIKQRLEVKQQ